MIVRELLTKLGFDDSGAAKKLKKFNGAVNGAVKGLSATVAGATAAGGALFALSKNVAAGADDIAKNARSLALSTDAYQEYMHATELAGLSQTDFFNGTRKFSQSIGEAANGVGTYVDIFDQLGITVTNNEGKIKSVDALLQETSQSFAAMEDGAQKTNIAVKLFGRSGARMSPFLSQGTDAINAQREEAQELNKVLTETQLAQAEAFNDQVFSRLGGQITGIKNAIGSALLPVFTELAGQASEYIKNNQDIITGKIKTAVMAIANAVKWLAENTDKVIAVAKILLGLKLVAWLAGLAMTLKGLGIAALLTNPIGLAIVGLTALGALIWKFREPLMAMGKWLIDAFKKPFKVIDQLADKIAGLLKKAAKVTGLFGLGRKIGEGVQKIRDSRLKEMTVSGLPSTNPNVLSRLQNPSLNRLVNNRTNVNNNFNVTENVTVNVPAGSTEEQARSIEQQVRDQFGAEMAKIYRKASNQMPAVQ